MDFRIRLQLAEALGPINRWFCSEAYGREIDHPDVLLEYYIKSGGAEDFATRYSHAIGSLNRWYCSEFYRSDIRDPKKLWDYYVNYSRAVGGGRDPRNEAECSQAELRVA